MSRVIRSLVVILYSILLSCNDDTIATPLPDNAIIEIINKDLANGRISLTATAPTGNQQGFWSIASVNLNPGVFESTSSSTTRFTGSILEFYDLRWTISNGEENISNDIRVLMCQGEQIHDVVAIERDIVKLIALTRANIFTMDELYDTDITLPELLDSGATLDELLEAERIDHLVLREEGGITVQQMLSEGIPLQDIFDSFYYFPGDPNATGGSHPYLRYLLDEDINIEVADLIALGATVSELYIHGVTIEEIIEAGLPIKDIISDDRRYVDILDLVLENNITFEQLINQDIIRETSTTGLYVFKHILGEYNPRQIADDTVSILNSIYPNLGGTWRLPSLDELAVIYEQRETLDLRIDWINPPDMWESIYVSSIEDDCFVDTGLVLSLPYGIDFQNGSIKSCMGYQSYTRTFSLPVIQL